MAYPTVVTHDCHMVGPTSSTCSFEIRAYNVKTHTFCGWENDEVVRVTCDGKEPTEVEFQLRAVKQPHYITFGVTHFGGKGKPLANPNGGIVHGKYERVNLTTVLVTPEVNDAMLKTLHDKFVGISKVDIDISFNRKVPKGAAEYAAEYEAKIAEYKTKIAELQRKLDQPERRAPVMRGGSGKSAAIFSGRDQKKLQADPNSADYEKIVGFRYTFTMKPVAAEVPSAAQLAAFRKQLNDGGVGDGRAEKKARLDNGQAPPAYSL